MAIAGFDLGAIFSPNFFRILGFGLTIVALLIVLGAVAFFLYYILSYNVVIEYFDKRRHINRIRKTTAKKVIQDGIPKLKIWMMKGSLLKLPDTNIVFKIGKKDKIFMTRDFSGHFNFVEWGRKLEKDVLDEVPPEARLWESLQYKKNIQRFQKQSFWDKYGDMIVQYGFIVVLIFMLILLASKFKIVADSLNTAIQAAQTCQQL